MSFEKPRDWLGGLASLLVMVGVLALLSINLFVIPSRGLATAEAFFSPGELLPQWAGVGRAYGLLYIALGLLQIVQVYKLYHYIKIESDLTRIGSLFGLMSALLFAASGGLYYYAGYAISQAYPAHPEAALIALQGISSAGSGVAVPADITISLWSLLLGIAALRGNALPRAMAGLGMLIGVANIVAQLTMSIPAAMIAFTLSPVWSLWLAWLLFRNRR